jgi:hypothetical protein
VIAYNAGHIGKAALQDLMDSAPTSASSEIRRVAASVPGVEGLHRCRVRKSAFDYYTEWTSGRPRMPVWQAHEIAHDVQNAVRAANPRIVRVLVHSEPSEEEHAPTTSRRRGGDFNPRIYAISSGTRCTVSCSPVRRNTVTGTRTPTRSSVRRRCRSSIPATGTPPSATITSPSFSAGAVRRAVRADLGDEDAGLRAVLSGEAARQADVLAADADHGAPDAAALDQFPGDPFRGVDRGREADALRGGDDRCVTPMTCPRLSTSGPPELPGLSAASVWITLSSIRPPYDGSERPSADTTPAVTDV